MGVVGEGVRHIQDDDNSALRAMGLEWIVEKHELVNPPLLNVIPSYQIAYQRGCANEGPKLPSFPKKPQANLLFSLFDFKEDPMLVVSS